ncbi:hypothetical protein DFH08DRAFT_818628 [Mycena albidolilacea]|uniref:Uncharacterized protein n=1 Tax=Mycena albidolilacea TaxID=1033008 RepID=A0AAD7EFN8_9AGAR|nr:hypothetical protein DFH08DRAFT_818628 [Mycena albidolilacea]
MGLGGVEPPPSICNAGSTNSIDGAQQPTDPLHCRWFEVQIFVLNSKTSSTSGTKKLWKRVMGLGESNPRHALGSLSTAFNSKGKLKNIAFRSWVSGESNPRRAPVEVLAIHHMGSGQRPIDPFLCCFEVQIFNSCPFEGRHKALGKVAQCREDLKRLVGVGRGDERRPIQRESKKRLATENVHEF